MEQIEIPQTLVFLYAIILGFCSSIIYDTLKIIRYLDRKNLTLTIIMDIVFLIICAFLTMIFAIGYNQGEVRLFTIVGHSVGFAVYLFTVGKITNRIIIFISKKIAYIVVKSKIFIKKLTGKIYKINYLIINIKKQVINPINKVKNIKKVKKV